MIINGQDSMFSMLGLFEFIKDIKDLSKHKLKNDNLFSDLKRLIIHLCKYNANFKIGETVEKMLNDTREFDDIIDVE
jgi:hypothetical protein